MHMTDCTVCFRWINGLVPAPSVGPIFPSDDWDVVAHEDVAIGFGDVVMRGTARCKGCGAVHTFDCRYPGGYYFLEGEHVLDDAWNNAVYRKPLLQGAFDASAKGD